MIRNFNIAQLNRTIKMNIKILITIDVNQLGVRVILPSVAWLALSSKA